MKTDFLISSERSGSNLLTKLIDSHPFYCGPTPPHLLRIFTQNLHKYYPLDKDENWQKLVVDVYDFFNCKIGVWKSVVSKEELFEISPRNLAELVKYIYQKEARLHKKSRIFIKEVRTYNFFNFLNDNFSDSKFIWLVRDPRDMALSWSNSPVHRGDIVRAARIWKEDQQATLKIFNKHPDKICLIKYEDLIADQIVALKKICTFLNIGYDSNMIDFHSKDITGKNALQTDNWKNLNKKIISENSKKYQTKLTQMQIQFIEYVCSDEMKNLNYQLDFKPMTAAEFKETESQLLKEERQEKVEYRQISEVEKNKRLKWFEKLNEIHNR